MPTSYLQIGNKTPGTCSAISTGNDGVLFVNGEGPDEAEVTLTNQEVKRWKRQVPGDLPQVWTERPLFQNK
jgi:hypothetical protein